MRERLTYIGVIVALMITLVLMLKDCESKDHQIQIANQNMQALTDRVRESKNDLGQLQYEKKIFMGDIETLKRLNEDLVKEVNAQKGKVRVITKVVTQVVFDTIRIENKVDKINDSTYLIGFQYKKDYDSLNSIAFKGSIPTVLKTENEKVTIESSTTTVTDLSMNMKLYTGIREENGTYSIFAKTDFPGVKFDLEGAVVDPEENFVTKKSGPFSVMLGAGLGYGLTQNGSGLFPSVGVFVGINLFHF